VKISANTDERDAINTLVRTTDQKETLEEKEQQNIQDIYMEDHAVRRSNSVSKITQHFKILQEKTNASIENRSQCIAPLGVAKSYGIQRFRERKAQSGERFSTQPVTFQEVREAVLQNQRNVALNVGTTDDDLIEPSKLSLTERVRLFNQKIATTETDAATNATYRERLSQKRRSVTRYKTQPVTSEEVEVASRISPLNVMNYQTQMLFGGKYGLEYQFSSLFLLIFAIQAIFIISDSKECQKTTYSSSSITMPQHDLPKSILKSSACYTQNMPRVKSPELQGIKLIKSMLKRESEESEQSTILSSTSLEIYPRSILKSNFQLKSIQTPNITDAATSRNETSIHNEDQNLNNEIIKPREKLNSSNVITDTTISDTSQCLYDVEQIITCKEDDITEKGAAVPLHKTIMSRNEKILLSDNVDNCRINTILTSISKEHDNKWCDDSLADKSECVLDNKDNDTDIEKKDKEEKEEQKEKKDVEIEQNNGDSDDNDHASSSSGGQEIHDIVSEKHANIIQYPANLLAETISQHSVSDEKRKRQCDLPSPCRSATQVIKSIEMNEMPSMSIADRLAALRHNGSTNWRRRIVEGNNDESCNDSPLNLEESMTIKSGVLANCMEKLESAVENWKNRIVAPDAINFTIAGKMKMIPSKDPSSLFVTEYSMTNTPNQKKKIPRWYKTKKDKGEISCNRIIIKKSEKSNKIIYLYIGEKISLIGDIDLIFLLG